jgi:hypothetical protein
MIIGMTGKAGSGKDTVADILVREHGFVKVAFADPLKRLVRDVYAFTDEQLWGPSDKRNAPDLRYPRPHSFPPNCDFRAEHCTCCGTLEQAPGLMPQCYLTPRHALQQLGTEWGRGCYPNTWVEYALRTADTLLREGCEYYPTRGLTVERADEPPRGVVISDVRFPNEVEALRAKGAMIWKTTRGQGLQGAAATHASEKYIDELTADVIFPPNLTLEQLPQVVRNIFNGVSAT